MSRNRILLILVITLAIFNIGLIYVHFFSGKEHSKTGRDNLRSWLTRNLNLSKEQEATHINMRNAYFEKLQIFNDSLRQIKARFVALSASNELTDSLASMWTDSINRWHTRADKLTYQHVQNVRAILNSTQQPIWDSLMKVVMLGKGRE